MQAVPIAWIPLSLSLSLSHARAHYPPLSVFALKNTSRQHLSIHTVFSSHPTCPYVCIMSENVANELFLIFPAEVSMSCSSYLDGLWDRR